MERTLALYQLNFANVASISFYISPISFDVSVNFESAANDLFETFWWNRGGPRVIRVCNSLFGTGIWPLHFNVMRGTTTTRDYSAKQLKIIRKKRKEGKIHGQQMLAWISSDYFESLLLRGENDSKQSDEFQATKETARKVDVFCYVIPA